MPHAGTSSQANVVIFNAALAAAEKMGAWVDAVRLGAWDMMFGSVLFYVALVRLSSEL